MSGQPWCRGVASREPCGLPERVSSFPTQPAGCTARATWPYRVLAPLTPRTLWTHRTKTVRPTQVARSLVDARAASQRARTNSTNGRAYSKRASATATSIGKSCTNVKGCNALRVVHVRPRWFGACRLSAGAEKQVNGAGDQQRAPPTAPSQTRAPSAIPRFPSLIG